jgi:cell division protein FtsB
LTFLFLSFYHSESILISFLNVSKLERQGADLETKIEELQDINQVLREKDKMKEDVIANLSDKLIMLSERLDALEKFNRKDNLIAIA